MFHSTQFIPKTSVSSPEAADAVAPPAPKARRPRRALWFALAGLAAVAIVGAGASMVHPVCGYALPPINPINLKSMLSPQQSRLVKASGRLTQAAPLNSSLAHKANDASRMALRPDGTLAGAFAPQLNQPVHAGSAVPN